MKKELELLQLAAATIKSLRKENEIMKARLDMFDNVMFLLNTNAVVQRYGAVSPNIVWEIEKFVADNTAK